MDWFNQGDGAGSSYFEDSSQVVSTVLDTSYMLCGLFLRTMGVLENRADLASSEEKSRTQKKLTFTKFSLLMNEEIGLMLGVSVFSLLCVESRRNSSPNDQRLVNLIFYARFVSLRRKFLAQALVVLLKECNFRQATQRQFPHQ